MSVNLVIKSAKQQKRINILYSYQPTNMMIIKTTLILSILLYSSLSKVMPMPASDAAIASEVQPIIQERIPVDGEEPVVRANMIQVPKVPIVPIVPIKPPKIPIIIPNFGMISFKPFPQSPAGQTIWSVITPKYKLKNVAATPVLLPIKEASPIF